MRLRITHETRYQYQQPINGLIQTLRLTPAIMTGSMSWAGGLMCPPIAGWSVTRMRSVI